MAELQRLQKYLAAAGVASRRKAEVLIHQGRVTVNGEPAHVGMSVGDDDVIRVNGIAVGAQAKAYIMLNKPADCVTTMDDPQGRQTVLDFVRSESRVVPVGRLDKDTTGLLLLTNDGELAHRFMHPSFGVRKTYHALVRGSVNNQTVNRLAEGVELDDGMTSPADVRVVQKGRDKSLLELIIHEGKNRQVRRMCEAVSHPVIELARTAYGPLTLGNLSLGESRNCTEAEIRKLYKAAGMSPARHRDSESR